jgi:hypothetical protein
VDEAPVTRVPLARVLATGGPVVTLPGIGVVFMMSCALACGAVVLEYWGVHQGSAITLHNLRRYLIFHERDAHDFRGWEAKH